jgi:hypothetical protein
MPCSEMEFLTIPALQVYDVEVVPSLDIHPPKFT